MQRLVNVNQMWISSWCKWRNCQKQDPSWEEINRRPTENKREKQPEAQEALPKCSVNEKVQNKNRKKIKMKKWKSGKAFHLRIYAEFQNLMRWADGQIMLCKWYVHKSQTDFTLRPLTTLALTLALALDSEHKKQPKMTDSFHMWNQLERWIDW